MRRHFAALEIYTHKSNGTSNKVALARKKRGRGRKRRRWRGKIKEVRKNKNRRLLTSAVNYNSIEMSSASIWFFHFIKRRGPLKKHEEDGKKKIWAHQLISRIVLKCIHRYKYKLWQTIIQSSPDIFKLTVTLTICREINQSSSSRPTAFVVAFADSDWNFATAFDNGVKLAHIAVSNLNL